MLRGVIPLMVLPLIWQEMRINMLLQVQVAMIRQDGRELLRFHQRKLDFNAIKEPHMASRTMSIK